MASINGDASQPSYCTSFWKAVGMGLTMQAAISKGNYNEAELGPLKTFSSVNTMPVLVSTRSNG